MSEYGVTDFDESLDEISVEEIAHVHAAWGISPEGFGSWNGGFLLELKTGEYVYVTGWCDTTGWGCQDGREEERFAAKPDLAALGERAGRPAEEAPLDLDDWDIDPADLNRWVANPARDRWSFS